jgi:hypothetical protein
VQIAARRFGGAITEWPIAFETWISHTADTSPILKHRDDGRIVIEASEWNHVVERGVARLVVGSIRFERRIQDVLNQSQDEKQAWELAILRAIGDMTALTDVLAPLTKDLLKGAPEGVRQRLDEIEEGAEMLSAVLTAPFRAADVGVTAASVAVAQEHLRILAFTRLPYVATSVAPENPVGFNEDGSEAGHE